MKTEDILITQIKAPIIRLAHVLEWQSEVYGFGEMFREFGFYPKWLPLNICSAHGIQFMPEPRKSELENKAPVMFYFNKEHTEQFKLYGLKPCYTIVAPNIFYRKKYNIVKDENAQGTLVFPGHSTPLIDIVSSISNYINKLNELSEQFHPLTICLHQHDIVKGVHKEYINNGFKVVTVGNIMNPKYIENFYKILKRFKYTTSNQIGSYTFYSVDMKIPFFLYGEKPVLVNRGNNNGPKGLWSPGKNVKSKVRAIELFREITTSISKEQSIFVNSQLGVENSISRPKMALILYYTYVLYLKNKMLKKAKRLVRKVFNRLKSIM